jgi:hypothetical protein
MSCKARQQMFRYHHLHSNAHAGEPKTVSYCRALYCGLRVLQGTPQFCATYALLVPMLNVMLCMRVAELEVVTAGHIVSYGHSGTLARYSATLAPKAQKSDPALLYAKTPSTNHNRKYGQDSMERV